MQKLLRHSELVRRQAARRSAKEAGKKAVDKKQSIEHELLQQRREINADIHKERRARREDWIQGPLAPKRDVGDAAKTFGTISTTRVRAVEKLKWKKYGIVEGDRVVFIQKGHWDRGKIGKVTDVSEESETCTIEGINTV